MQGHNMVNTSSDRGSRRNILAGWREYCSREMGVSIEGRVQATTSGRRTMLNHSMMHVENKNRDFWLERQRYPGTLYSTYKHLPPQAISSCRDHKPGFREVLRERAKARAQKHRQTFRVAERGQAHGKRYGRITEVPPNDLTGCPVAQDPVLSREASGNTPVPESGRRRKAVGKPADASMDRQGGGRRGRRDRWGRGGRRRDARRRGKLREIRGVG